MDVAGYRGRGKSYRRLVIEEVIATVLLASFMGVIFGVIL